MENSSSSSSSGRLDFWDAEKMLDLYLHDYMVKKSMHETAEIFRKEANVYTEKPVAIETKEGFLNEWWSLFHDVYSSRTSELKPQLAKQPEAQHVQGVEKKRGIDQQQQCGHQKVPEDLSRVTCSALSLPITKHKRSKRTPRTRNINCLSKWLEIPGGELSRKSLNVNNWNVSKSHNSISSPHLQQQKLLKSNAQIQVQDNRKWISFGKNKNIGSNFFGMHNYLLSPNVTPNASKSGDEPGSKTGKPVKEICSTLKASNHQGLIEPSTAEHPRSSNKVDQDGEEMKTESEDVDRHSVQSEKVSANNEDLPVKEISKSFVVYEDDSACGGTSTTFKPPKRRGENRNHENGFKFEEICSLHSSTTKVTCCHFSSNGSLLATAGHDKKVLIWNMETFDVVKSSEEHDQFITDVRFRPNSTMFATSSYDGKVRIWDANRPSKAISKLEGNSNEVMSVDFHPRKLNLLASSDGNNDIKLWNVNQGTCTDMFKGATKQVRFQPRFGKYLAVTSGNRVNIFDVETASFDLYMKGYGHVEDVSSICWDTSGKFLASVSEDSARIWCSSSRKCIHELHSNGNKFQSGTFHPAYSLLLIIGCDQDLELWSPTLSRKTVSIPAHKGIVAALATSPKTDMIASGSHDQVVKLWK